MFILENFYKICLFFACSLSEVARLLPHCTDQCSTGRVSRVNLMAVFECRELINVEEGFVAIARWNWEPCCQIRICSLDFPVFDSIQKKCFFGIRKKLFLSSFLSHGKQNSHFQKKQGLVFLTVLPTGHTALTIKIFSLPSRKKT